MSLISKIAGYAATKVANCTGKALKYTKVKGGIPVEHYVKTGTEVLNTGGLKSIAFGKGNKLSQYATHAVSYPKGFFGNSNTRTIAFFGANGEPICAGTPVQVKDF